MDRKMKGKDLCLMSLCLVEKLGGMMYRKLILIFFLGILTTNASVSVPSNLIVAAEEEDTLEKVAEEYVKEAEKIFKETENDLEERRSRISQFTSKVTKVLSTPFTKALTKVTLIQMEVICSAIDDFESAGFATFPQAFILLEVLGKKYVDSGQVIKALSNKRNDWKFRWIIAEIICGFHISNEKVTNIMMDIILDKSENIMLKNKCLFSLSAKGTTTYKEKPIGEYLMQISKEEKELKGEAEIKLGMMKYRPALDMLIQSAKEDSLKPIMALGYMRDKKALPVLFNLLKGGKYRRARVCDALGKIGGDEAIDTLINIALNDKDHWVRYSAKKGLAFSENDRAYEFLIKHKEVKALARAGRFGAIRAYKALKKIGTPKALEELRKLSTPQGSPVKEFREKAKEVLKEVESKK